MRFPFALQPDQGAGSYFDITLIAGGKSIRAADQEPQRHRRLLIRTDIIGRHHQVQHWEAASRVIGFRCHRQQVIKLHNAAISNVSSDHEDSAI